MEDNAAVLKWLDGAIADLTNLSTLSMVGVSNIVTGEPKCLHDPTATRAC